MLLWSTPAWSERDGPWTDPTPEELAMTAQPEVPGAAAVYLYHEETTDDDAHTQTVYVRLKVLKEQGRRYADVSLDYSTVKGGGFGYKSIDITGRTIHSDGSIIPFTGKPFERVLEKTRGEKVTEKIFTLPDVQIGSILEYRYVMHIEGDWFVAPTWRIQKDLYMRKGYFLWKATSRPVGDSAIEVGDRLVFTGYGHSWSSVLPPGAEIKKTLVQSALTPPYEKFELNVQNTAPIPDEDYMPPVDAFIYRAHFYYSTGYTSDAFWSEEGKFWLFYTEKFLGASNTLKDAVDTLIDPKDDDDTKLGKIYAAVMAMDNTSFSRAHDADEDKAGKLKPVKSVKDIWERKRGTDDALTVLFIGLARAAGFKAYAIKVANREKRIFLKGWLSLDQLDDDLAIVQLDGREAFFDPGQRYCPFGQLSWKHSGVEGLREMEAGVEKVMPKPAHSKDPVKAAPPATPAEIAAKAGIGELYNDAKLEITPTPSSADTRIYRTGNLSMDAAGSIHGTLKFIWTGAAALELRQQALRSDEKEMKHEIEQEVQDSLQQGVQVELVSVENTDQYEQPLLASFNVTGQLAVTTAKRMILPEQFFEATSKPVFTVAERTMPIYFDYGKQVFDSVRITLPAGFKPESAPKDESVAYQDKANYSTKFLAQPGFIQMKRTYGRQAYFFTAKEYPEVRAFYNSMVTADQQPVVLIKADTASAQPVVGK